MRSGVNHFARAKQMFAAIAALAALPFHLQEAARKEIGPYRSRGKGRDGYQASHHRVAYDKRAALKARNRARHRARQKLNPRRRT